MSVAPTTPPRRAPRPITWAWVALCACGGSPEPAAPNPKPTLPLRTPTGEALPTPTMDGAQPPGPPPAAEPPVPPTPVADPPPWVHAKQDLTVRAGPSSTSARRGRVLSGSSFSVREDPPIPGPGCTAGWIAVRGSGFVCALNVEPTDIAPAWPDPPATPPGSRIDRQAAEGEAPPGSLPLLYGWPRGGPQRHEYDDPRALARGEPGDELEAGASLRFTGVQESAEGPMLVRPDGHLVRPKDVAMYAASPFSGLPDGQIPAEGLPAWATSREGLGIRERVGTSAMVLWTAPWHSPVRVVRPEGVEAPWWAVYDPTEANPPGWAREGAGLRRWLDAPPPHDIGDALWVDVVLSQQVIALRRGAEVLGVTLVSTGKPGFETPVGLYRVYDKARWWDMISAPGRAEPWHVEGVPWTLHFRPMYAIHGAFWHDDFGQVRSHGCVNLAPADARFIFDALPPALPTGWHMVWASEEEPGAVVRIRRAAEVDLPDHRQD